jgi:hypothetical protein
MPTRLTVTSHDISAFWAAPESALFDQIVVAAVIGYSTAWMERKRWEGEGIPYRKIGRKCRYVKRDVLEWLAQFQRVTSTSQTELSRRGKDDSYER